MTIAETGRGAVGKIGSPLQHAYLPCSPGGLVLWNRAREMVLDVGVSIRLIFGSEERRNEDSAGSHLFAIASDSLASWGGSLNIPQALSMAPEQAASSGR